MVHRLTESRLFMVTLAALMLLAFMPWQGIGTCCCCDDGDEPADLACCCEVEAPEAPAPEKPGPCPCSKMAGKAVGLPAALSQDEGEQAVALPYPAGMPAVASAATAPLHVPLPRARTGPLLYLRLRVLLI